MTSARQDSRPEAAEPTTRDLYRTAFAGPSDVDEQRTAPDVDRAAARPGAVLAAGLTLALGGWLVVAPYLLGYADVGGVAGHWTGAVVGAAVAGLALVRLRRPLRSLVPAVLCSLLGIWLLMAASVLGYSDTAPRAAVNEPVTGGLILLCGLAGIGFLLAGRRSEDDPA
jgi:peptidoglycan/LPS O-acetylase OafA/YrhL